MSNTVRRSLLSFVISIGVFVVFIVIDKPKAQTLNYQLGSMMDKMAQMANANSPSRSTDCDSLAEGEADGWLVPGNVFRFQLFRSVESAVPVRQQMVSDARIQYLIAKAGACYYIRSVTLTTRSETKTATMQYRDLLVTEVWNDSLILVMERRR